MTARIIDGKVIAAELRKVEARAPLVIDAYRGRLNERLQKLLAEVGVQGAPGDIVREVALFAERTDISEVTESPGNSGTLVRTALQARL